MLQGMSFDEFANALASDAGLETASVDGWAKVDGPHDSVLRLAQGPSGSKWVDLPKSLVKSITLVPGAGAADAERRRVRVVLSEDEGGSAAVAALVRLLAAESALGGTGRFWYDARQSLTFDEFAEAQAAGGFEAPAVIGWAKLEPGKCDRLHLSPQMDCGRWIPIPKQLVGSVTVLRSRTCTDASNGPHAHPVVGVVLADPGAADPASASLLRLLAARREASDVGRRSHPLHVPPGRRSGGGGFRCPDGSVPQTPHEIEPCTHREDGTFTSLWQPACGEAEFLDCTPPSAVVRTLNMTGSASLHDGTGWISTGDVDLFFNLTPSIKVVTGRPETAALWHGDKGDSRVEIEVIAHTLDDLSVVGTAFLRVSEGGRRVATASAPLAIPAGGTQRINLVARGSSPGALFDRSRGETTLRLTNNT